MIPSSAVSKTTLLLFVYCFVSHSIFSQNIYKSIPQSAINEDPNINPNWDWRMGDYPDRIYPDAAYSMYHRSDNGQHVLISIQAPWTQSNAWPGLLDNKYEDGWRLISRDFGTSTRPVSGVGVTGVPYFAIYNIHRSLLRFYVFVRTNKSWNKGFVELTFKDPNDPSKVPAVLAHLKPIAHAVDKFEMMSNSASSVFSDVLRNNHWLWADFPMSFDPTIIPKNDLDPPSLYFRIYGQDLSDIELKGVAQGAQGKAEFVNNYLTGAYNGNGPAGITGLRMPNLIINPNLQNISLSGLNLKPFGTQTDWKDFASFLIKMGINIAALNAGVGYSDAFNAFSIQLSNISNMLPFDISGAKIEGLFDFLISGGSKPKPQAEPIPAPSFIALNLELAGTITSTFPIHEIRISIPNTRDEYWKPGLGSAVGIVRNDPVGVLTLEKTPRLQKRSFTKYFFDYSDPIRGDIYKEIDFEEYTVADDVQLTLNNSSGLKLIKSDVYLTIDYSSNYPLPLIFTWQSLKQQDHLIELESPLASNSAKFRSMPAPIKFIKGRTLSFPKSGSSNVLLKIKSVLQRIDDPGAQPVVIISTYNTDIIDLGLMPQSYASPDLPTIPPQNIKCIIPQSGGVRVSWDRNLEKNIIHYSIERSINNGSFHVIGSTADTVFTDNEIQKAVKPYTTNRQNVSVKYRVRAKAEWIDDENISKTQYSNYGDPVQITGSTSMFSKTSDLSISPTLASLSQNFPNPFNPSTTIYYSVASNEFVSIKVFNSLGQEVASLVNEEKETGHHYAEWNAVNQPSGIYFYRITAGDFSETRKMTLMK